MSDLVLDASLALQWFPRSDHYHCHFLTACFNIPQYSRTLNAANRANAADITQSSIFPLAMLLSNFLNMKAPTVIVHKTEIAAA